MRARRGRGAPGGPGAPDNTGARAPETGSHGLPFRVRRPGPPSSHITARDKVILSDRDLAAIWKALATARQDPRDERQDAAGGRSRTGPGPGPRAEEPRETWPPEPRGSAPPPAMTPALPDANPGPPRGTVLANTIGMWARRRFWPATARWRVVGALVLAVVLFGGGAVTVTLTRGTTAAKGAADGGQAPGDAAFAVAAAARTAAGAWIARQVDSSAIVACDPQMCAVLQGQGIPAGRLLVLRAGNAGPLGSEVIISTAAVREEFGSRLTSVYAPVALATFGSGSAQVAIRVIAADGSAAYLRRLRADATARRAVGALLPRNPHLRVSPAGRRELAAGQVDARLLSVIAALATPYRVEIVGFGAPAAGASPGVPLRSADIAPAAASRGQDAATLSSIKRFLLAQQATFRPADVITVRLASGQTVLRVEFTAPSPLGLLGAPPTYIRRSS